MLLVCTQIWRSLCLSIIAALCNCVDGQHVFCSACDSTGISGTCNRLAACSTDWSLCSGMWDCTVVHDVVGRPDKGYLSAPCDMTMIEHAAFAGHVWVCTLLPQMCAGEALSCHAMVQGGAILSFLARSCSSDASCSTQMTHPGVAGGVAHGGLRSCVAFRCCASERMLGLDDFMPTMTCTSA
jgi:hypothetical protein